MISLNIKSVTDEIFALTALRSAVTGTPAGLLPPVLTRDNLPALRILVRTAFATLVTRLMPYVADSSVDDGNPPAASPYDERQPVTLDIGFGDRTASMGAGNLMTLKRYLEHLLALYVLEKVYLPVDTAIAAGHASEASSVISTVATLLAGSSSPGLLAAAYL